VSCVDVCSTAPLYAASEIHSDCHSAAGTRSQQAHLNLIECISMHCQCEDQLTSGLKSWVRSVFCHIMLHSRQAHKAKQPIKHDSRRYTHHSSQAHFRNRLQYCMHIRQVLPLSINGLSKQVPPLRPRAQHVRLGSLPRKSLLLHSCCRRSNTGSATAHSHYDVAGTATATSSSTATACSHCRVCQQHYQQLACTAALHMLLKIGCLSCSPPSQLLALLPGSSSQLYCCCLASLARTAGCCCGGGGSGWVPAGENTAVMTCVTQSKEHCIRSCTATTWNRQQKAQ
jgi:hypothetical protein